MQMYIEPSWGDKWQNLKIVEFGSCRRSKILIPAATFDEFCKRKFDRDQKVVLQFVSESPKVFELPLSTIFSYKNSHGFFQH